MPKCVVVETAFSWGDDKLLRTPWHETVIYEVHVKGFTARHPQIAPELRGTYAALASPPALEHLRRLGVTAVELLPVHHSVTERHLEERGLTNYWGYNSIGFLAPDSALRVDGRARGAGGGIQDHGRSACTRRASRSSSTWCTTTPPRATTSGPPSASAASTTRPTIGSRERTASYYRDYTGCGNTLDLTHPRSLQLLMDSLRYWVLDMHVDGFRFDLASALARELHDVDRLSSFFDVIHQDPVISQVKLIAEPWDLGEGGYQVGNFPPGWAEWNGRYRDTIRRYWKGDGGQVGELAYRLTGSSDLYEQGGRRPSASINFVTAHDGFTLADLVTYTRKRNAANGEDNRDGSDENFATNCGIEGPTDDLAVRTLPRAATAELPRHPPPLPRECPCSRGATSSGGPSAATTTPTARTASSRGSPGRPPERPPGCSTSRAGSSVSASTIPCSGGAGFFQGRRIQGSAVKDLSWLQPDGAEMTDEEWNNGQSRCLGLQLAGDAIEEIDDEGLPIRDDTFLILLERGRPRSALRPAQPSAAHRVGGRARHPRLGPRPRGATLQGRRALSARRTHAGRAPPASEGACVMADLPEFESEMHRTAVAQLDRVAERLDLDHDTHIRLRYPRRASWCPSPCAWTTGGRKSSWATASITTPPSAPPRAACATTPT